MHRPAAVHFMVCRSRWLVRVLFSLWLLGLVSMVAFFRDQVVSLQSAAVWSLAILLISGLAWHIWRGMPLGQLRWDGSAWYWSGFEGEVPCTVTLHMDFQRLLIVSARRPGAPTAWQWLETFPNISTGWLPLRRALAVGAISASTQGLVDPSVSEQEAR